MTACSLVPVADAIEALTAVGHAAWQEGLLCGYSGNMSMRAGADQIIITAAGSIKGFLQSEDFLLVNNAGTPLLGARSPSSEMALHLAIYEAFPECKAILHTHPPHLQALEPERLAVDLYEAQFWLRRLAPVPAIPPGDIQLGQSCVDALRAMTAPLPRGAWLARHGLCALGENIRHCLAFSEEMEHLAQVQLLRR